MSRTSQTTDLKLSDNINDFNFQNQNLTFSRLRPPLATIAMPKVEVCFQKHISALFLKKLTRTRSLCYLHEESLDPFPLSKDLHQLTLTNDTPAFPPIFFPLVVHVLVLFLRAISPLHLPSCYIPSTPLPVLALPCNPYKCHKFCLSLLFSPEEAKLAKRREKRNYRWNLL